VGDHLAADPVLGTVVATVATREAGESARGTALPADRPHWYAVAREAGAVVGVAMRTAPFEPHPLFVLPMPDPAARRLARALHDRGERVEGVNGALPAARLLADETARLAGGSVRVAMHTRLFELGELAPPAPPPGQLRPVTEDEAGLALEWFHAFHRDADEQAGREPGVSPHEAPTDDEMTRRIESGRVFVWVDDDDCPVNVTAATLPAYGVSRIGPVYTPRGQRGRGYASAAVYAVSKLLRDSGERACLFTDQANPTSNKIYEALGYRRLVDMANLRVE
jgi:GNAT superfamily N-acetyltransferase